MPGLPYYMMNNKRHGVALIVNNKRFHKHSERVGSDRDEANLVQTWLYLGYRVEVRRDLTSMEVKAIFDNIDSFLTSSDKSACKDNSVSHDSFVCCFLSHGTRDDIIGVDSKGIKTDEIARMIGRSKKLQKKPKLFFVQACRGQHAGAEIQADDDQQYRHVATDRSDMYFSFATVPGNQSYRDTIKGSWFITELCKMLCKYASSCTLHDIQLKVNSAVPGNAEYVVPAGAKYAQQPANAGTMTKHVHFFDGASA